MLVARSKLSWWRKERRAAAEEAFQWGKLVKSVISAAWSPDVWVQPRTGGSISRDGVRSLTCWRVCCCDEERCSVCSFKLDFLSWDLIWCVYALKGRTVFRLRLFPSSTSFTEQRNRSEFQQHRDKLKRFSFKIWSESCFQWQTPDPAGKDLHVVSFCAETL